MQCEVLVDESSCKRGRQMLAALIDCANSVGVKCVVSKQYQGAANWLISYGLGHPGRRKWIDSHLQQGGRLIGWDLGYWERQDHMRLTVDADHPQKLITDQPSERFDKYNIVLQDQFQSDGPIILAGMGEKSRIALGYKGLEWEASKLEELREVYPNKRILYKPKRPGERLKDVEITSKSIEIILNGASLLVCRHSNVSIDACIYGIPVVCWDGAASAIYGSELAQPTKPSKEQRYRFLSNLAWWQWKPSEATQAWNFIKKNFA